MRPRGMIAYDQQLADKAIAEGRNPFCAQCHGPGGALDPNNDWNSGDPARRAAFLRRLQWVDLGH
jgi:mono/diheme cytochrome c family protein